MPELPDALVLGSGGVLGAAWMAGVLAAIEDRDGLRMSDCGYFVGTSAGSVLAALLAAGERPPRPGDERVNRILELAASMAAATSATGSAETAAAGAADASAGTADVTVEPPTASAELRSTLEQAFESARARFSGSAAQQALSAASARLQGSAAQQALSAAGERFEGLAAIWLRDFTRASAPAGARARAAALRTLPVDGADNSYLERTFAGLRLDWDGRLRISAVQRDSGRRVVFGEPDAPDASVLDAVAASCALPGVFVPVRIDGHFYVDGGFWSPTSLDAAPVGRGGRILCLSPTASPFGTLGAPMRRGSRAAITVETTARKADGVSVELIVPDEQSAIALGDDLLASDRIAESIAAGYAQGRMA